MTEREKMAQIIAEYLCPQGKAHKTLYGAERKCYSRDNFAECEKVGECVDALIGAGIGDVSRRSQRYKKKIKRLKATMVQNEEAAREVIYQRTKRAEAAEHRAEVYERALYHTAISDTEYQEAIEQAQKELAEEESGKKEI